MVVQISMSSINPKQELKELIKNANKEILVENELPEGKKNDTNKLRYDLIPPECLQKLAEIITHGAKKYDANNWQNLAPERIYAALLRHIEAWRMGEIIDPDSGIEHLAHVLCNAIFLLWLDSFKPAAKTTYPSYGEGMSCKRTSPPKST